MNKTKAYMRLKKKQKLAAHGWAEPIPIKDRIKRYPLQEIRQVSAGEQREKSDSSNSVDMFGLRNLNGLKTYIEVVDLEQGPKPELTQSTTTLPNIASKHRYLRGRNPRVHREYNSTTNINSGYTLLEAKLDALILPTPMKRKVSSSFSGSSSGFHGRKIVQVKKDSARMKRVSKPKEEDNAAKTEGVQFPIASKMRQLLTVEQLEQPRVPQTAPAEKGKENRHGNWLHFILLLWKFD